MADRINNVDFRDYGIVLIKYKNLFAMPNRIAPYFYDWGNEVQPLVLAEDIIWSTNVVSIQVVWDARLGISLEQCLQSLRVLNETTLETKGVTFTGILLGVTDTQPKGSDFALLTIDFEQPIKDFDAVVLPSAVGGNGFGIDGYDFQSDFGIIVKETKYFNNVPEYALSKETVYKTPKKRNTLRKWGRVQVACAVPLAKIDGVRRLEKLLSTPDLKKVGHLGFSYDSFLSQGFKVEFFKSVAEFTVHLNIDLRDSTISLWGNSIKIPINDFTPTILDDTVFPSTNINGETTTKTYTIKNTGLGTLNVSAINVDGVGFSLSSGFTGNISGGGQATFSVAFNPSTKGTKTAIVSVVNSDLLFTPYPFKIQGSAWDSNEVGVMVVSVNGASVINGDNTPSVGDNTDFGEVESKSRTVSRVVALGNTGDRIINVSNISVQSGLYFSTADEGSVNRNISIGGSTTFVVRFNPQANGVFSPLVTITYNNGRDAGNSTFTFVLKGTGIEPAFVPYIKVEYNGVEVPDDAPPSLGNGTLYPSRVTFDEMTTHGWKVTNTGGVDIVAVVRTGSNAFTLNNFNNYVPIRADEFQMIYFRFAPTIEGNNEAVVEFKSLGYAFKLNLQGFGEPQPELFSAQFLGNGREIAWNFNAYNTQDGTDMGNVAPNNYRDQIFHIKNLGNIMAYLKADSVGIIDHSGYFSLAYPINTGLISQNDFQAVWIRFTAPSGGGSYTARIAIVVYSDPELLLGKTIVGMINIKATSDNNVIE